MGQDKFYRPFHIPGGVNAGLHFDTDGLLITELVVPLTAAQLIAMNATPVQILSAPGPSALSVDRSWIVLGWTFQMTRTATAFTGGGTVNLQYHTTTSSVPHAGTVAASVVTTGGAGKAMIALGPNVGSSGLIIPKNEGIDITNGTAAFAAGTGTAVVTILVCRVDWQ